MTIPFLLLQIWGNVDPPPGVVKYGTFNPLASNIGPGWFVSNIIRLLIVVAGIYAVFNFVLAGYGYLSAGGDPKRVADASAKIWQSLIGLLVVAGAFVIGMIASQIIFGNTTDIFQIRVFGP